MLESVLAGVLNRFLSAYVDNLNTGQLNVGIWSGDVKLRNLRLKKEALDKFRLPVDVVEGYLGDLTLSIPWSNLSGKPVRVLVENVYVLAVPTDSAKATPEEDAARAQAAKLEKLENAELMTAQPTTGLSAEEEQKNSSFTTSLVNKIVDNLQLEIRNIHIRYEDKLSVPGHPFSVGLTLSHFSAISTDEHWNPAFITNSKNGVHKLAKLDSLAVYFDTDSESLAGYSINKAIKKFTELIATKDKTPQHQFVLKPVSGQGRLIMNHHKVDAQTLKTDAELFFQELGFVLDADQYRDALSMVDLFHFYIRQREYRVFRPPQHEIDVNTNRALWKFATKAILTEVHEKNRKWSWAYFAERRDDRKEYVDLFKAKSRHAASPDELARLDELENKLGYRDIRFYRSIARSDLRKERATYEAEHPKPAKKQTGWISWATGWGGKAEDDSANDDGEGGLSEEQRKELYRAIDWDEKEAVSSNLDLPNEAMMLRVKAKLETGSFALRRGHQDLVALNFDDFALDLVQRPENFDATLALGGLRVFDNTCEGSMHQQIVRVKADKVKERNKKLSVGSVSRKLPPPEKREADDDVGQYDGEIGSPTALNGEDLNEDDDDEDDDEDDADGSKFSKLTKTKDPFFWLKFEHKPLDQRADNALAVRLRHMEIIYHRGYVEAIFKFFQPPESQLESVGALIDVASETLEGIRKETRAGLEYALAQHKTVDLQLDLNAPIIIIPEDVTRKDCQYIVLDAGHIAVESDLADQAAVDQVKAKEHQEYHDEDYQRLESLMYDKFHIKLESAQLLMGPSLKVCLEALDDGGDGHSHKHGELHILERTSLTFLAQNCILDQAPNLTRFKISGSLPQLQVNLSDRKYKSLMRMIDVALPKFGDDKNASEDAAARPPPIVTRHSSFARSRPVVHEDVEYHVEKAESEHEEDEDEDETGEKEEFFDTEDSPGGKQNIHQKTFEFTFQVDKVQASIFRSNPDPSKPDRLLANAVLQGFQFEFGLRPFDMSVDILLRSLYIEDKMVEAGNEFRHLVTSEELSGAHGKDLVCIQYRGVQKISPEFMTVHEGIDKMVDVEMSTINVVVTRGSILTLFDWVMTTFTDGGAGAPPPPSPGTPLGEEPAQVGQFNDKMRVKVKLTSINLILNEDGLRIATLSLSAADVSVFLRSPTMRVAARLGNLELLDDFSGDNPKQMLSIQGDELADFQYETYDPTDKTTYPGHDTLVYLRSGSLKFVFSEEPVHRMLVFMSKFGRMKAAYDAAAQAAAQRATEVTTWIPKMHYDILIRTPIVVFPRDGTSATKHGIIAHLGEISLANKFEVSDEEVVTKIVFELRQVRLSSTLDCEGEQDGHGVQILDDVTVHVDVTMTQTIDPSKELNKPGTLVDARMSDVKMHLPEAQYAALIALMQTVPRTFALADDEVEDESTTITPPRPLTPPPKDRKLDSVPEDGETVDLLPELASVARRADGTTVPLKSSLELTFAVKTVYLELFTIAVTTVDTLKDASLARFSLNETGVKYKMLSNRSMEAEVVVRSFTLHDTRPAKLTKFREIIPATKHDGHQFMISYSQSGGVDKSSYANIAIDTPKMVFSLDPLFALLDYFTSAFPKTPNTAPSKETEDDTVTSSDDRSAVGVQQPQPVSTFAFRVNIVSPTIQLLAHPDQSDSEAVVLSIDQILLSQQGTLVLNVARIGMFLCRMDRPKEKIRVIDDFDVTLMMDSRGDAGQQVTNIEIGIQPLILRVSYRDILLIQSIISRASELSNRGTPPPPEEEPARPDFVSASARQRSSTDPTRQSITGTKRKASGPASAIASANASLQAQLFITKETLKVTLDGFQLVLIGDLHDLPVFDIRAEEFTAEVHNWSSDLDAQVTIEPRVQCFNLRVSTWEPLVDPWRFSVNVSKPVTTGLLAITLSSQERLELNITSTFIELGLTTQAIIGREGEKLLTRARGSQAPFLIKNRTGYAMSLWSEGNHGGDAHRLADGDDAPWRFDDWRAMREHLHVGSRNSLTLQFEGTSWTALQNVSVDREGEHIYVLKPKLDKVSHRLMCEVKLVENVKVVTFRSTFLVQNRSLVNAEMVIVDEYGKKASQIYKILPGEDCPVPIVAAYTSRIRFRPDAGFGYAWSGEPLHWQALVKNPTCAIVCKSAKEAAFRFQAHAILDKSDPLVRVYPKLKLRLRAPVEVQNLLPHDIQYRVFDKNIEHNWTSYLREGGISPIHIAELSHLLLLSIDVQDTVFNRSEFAIINTDNPEDLPVEHDLVLSDKEKLNLNLRIHFQKHLDSGGAFRVQIYSPYILINKSGCDFALKTKTFMSSAKNVAGQNIFSSGQKRNGAEPFMFSFPTDDRRNRVLLRINDSNWSAPLSFETIGMETEVVLPSASGTEEIHIGLKVTEGTGDYKLTKVVTLYPRFIVKNSLDHDIRVRELGSTSEKVLAPGDRHPLGFMRAGRKPQLVLSQPGSPAVWSAPFMISDIGQNHVRVQRQDDEELLVRVDAMLEGPCIFIKLEPESKGWPFLFRNDSDYPITLCQALPEDVAAKGQKRRKQYQLSPRSKLPYAWDLPAETNKQLQISVNGTTRIVNVLEIGSQLPFKFPYEQHTGVLSIDVRAEGPTQSVTFSNYDEEDSVFKLQRRETSLSRAESTTSSNRDATFEAVDVDVVTTFSFGISFEGIGISLVNKKMQELVYASFRSLTFKYSDSTTNVAYDLSIKWIQVDNQLFGGLYPILLYPSVIPKDGKELEVHPSLQASVIILKDESHGVTYFKYASVLLQEMTVEVDEDFLFALLDFAKFSGATGQDEIPSKLTEEPAEIPEPQGSSGGGDVYFEVLHLQPIQLDLSFMRTDRVNVDQKLNTRNPFFFFINALTMALGNVNDAPVQLHALVIENVRLSLPVLQERLMLHYSNEFFGQLYRVLGSADFLGNPVGLFTNVSSGVADFFIQPYDSVMMNGNRDLGIGIARGAGSLAKKTVFGVSDSMAKVTGSIGKGLSAATLDKEYQNQRRMRQFRNKPKHALYGVTAGATSLITSVASGFEGLATKPLEGAEAEGAAGFLKGVGKGFVGLVTKPAVGLFDLANNVTEGIRNTTTVFDQSSIDRVRLPRFTASDGILRPYQEREALGQNWVKNVESGKYFNETYVAHLDIPSSDDTLAVVVTTTRILLVKVAKLKVGWDVPFSDLVTISLEATGITLKLRGNVPGPFLPIADQPARLWLFRHLERVVTAQ
ncbi:BQ2448_126 [Microbotryum intermedium]|uniref:BQ2448_126 protein n=1 Tax=Microbotryum intermedium TaxID=269621 RepID=A0A238F4P0_9BASI|nr:BQ2448_126 [Microbotryum intermedium]